MTQPADGSQDTLERRITELEIKASEADDLLERLRIRTDGETLAPQTEAGATRTRASSATAPSSSSSASISSSRSSS